MPVRGQGMPVQSRMSKQARRGAYTIGFVRRIFVAGGRPYCDVWDPETGRAWNGVPIMSVGGGPGQFQTVPLSAPSQAEFIRQADLDDASQVLLFHGEANRYPVTVGAIHHPSLDLQAKTEVVADDEDHSGAVGQRDFATVNGGTKFILDSRGRVTFDLRGAEEDGTFGVALAAGEIYRVSRDGNAAERLLLADAVVAYLGELEAHLAAQNARIAALEAFAETAATTLGIPYTSPLGVPAPTADGTLVSATFRVPVDSEEP